MPRNRPYYRTVRNLKEAANSDYSAWAYIEDRDYAQEPQHFVRAYLLIQNDLEKIFEYVEPSDLGASAYSFRIHELLMRTCIEIEANFKAILAANGYRPAQNRFGDILNIGVYRKVNVSHHLSSYLVLLPIWNGKRKTFKPFEGWASETELPWYRAYNESKHDRHEAFKAASLLSLVSAVAGLLVLISSQFGGSTFSAAGRSAGVMGYDYHDMDAATGGMFRIQYPNDWNDDELYEFNWSELKNAPQRFAMFDYNSVPND